MQPGVPGALRSRRVSHSLHTALLHFDGVGLGGDGCVPLQAGRCAAPNALPFASSRPDSLLIRWMWVLQPRTQDRR